MNNKLFSSRLTSHRLFACLLAAGSSWAPARAQGPITTIAGSDWIFPGDGKPALQAPLGDVRGVAAGPNGSFFLADRENGMIMRVDSDATLHVIAGNGLSGSAPVDGLAATAAVVSLPEAVALDRSGNVYYTEYGCRCVRKISTTGILTTVAGGGVVVPSDGGLATQAAINPFDIALDSAGNLFIADFLNSKIRKVAPNGIISTVGGSGREGFSGDGGAAAAANLNRPISLAIAPDGTLYFGDGQNNRIRKITPGGVIDTVTSSIGSPVGLAVGADGSLYASAEALYRITTTGATSIVAKNFFGNAWKVSADSSGNLYVADSSPSNGRVRKISPDGTNLEVAGNGGYRQSPDGTPATAAFLASPAGVALDPKGNLYIADTNARRIRKVTPDGSFFTIAGGGSNSPGDGGPGLAAALSSPLAIAADNAGNIFFTESNNRVRKLSANGILSTLAGGGPGEFKGDGGIATAAGINVPQGIAVDGFGNIYLADTFNQRIRKISTDGTINTVAGHGEAGFAGDGAPATLAELFLPVGIAVDSSGTLYIADTQNQRIRKVTPDGIITTLAGVGAPGFDGDGGPATSAHLQYPNAIAIAPDRDIYFSDTLNGRVRKISPSGIVTTVAGNGTGFAGDGGFPASALLNMPRGLAFDARGNLYIADSNNNRVRAILTSPPSFKIAPASVTFTGTAGGPATDGARVVVSGSVAGLLFATAFVTNNGVPWLQATPVNSAMPGIVEITADPSQLLPGTYQGTVTVIASAASPNFQNIPVTFTVQAPAPPHLNVDTTPVLFALARGSAPVSKSLIVANTGGGALSYTASADSAGWLAVAPAAGSLTSGGAPIVVTINPAGLNPGTYLGRVSITSATTGESFDVPVTLALSANPQGLVLSQSGLTFQAASLSIGSQSQHVAVLNTGTGVLNWTAAASTLTGGPAWLTVTPASGSGDATLTVGTSAANLNPGVYYGQVRVAAAGSVQYVTVVLNVLATTADPGPVVQPSGLIFTSVAPGSQNLSVSNSSGSTVLFNSGNFTFDGKPWISAAPATAAVPQNPATRIVVEPDLTGLDAGVRRGTLTLQFNDGASRDVDVLLVLPRPQCTPSKLLAVFTSPGAGFSVPALWGVPLGVRLVDDCGAPVSAGSVTVSFSNGDAPVSLTSLKDGNWAATWTPTAVGTVKMTATAAAGTLSGATQLAGAVSDNSGPPRIAAITGGANLGPPPVAPGEIVAIFGTFGAGTEVNLGGKSLPLLYSGDTQINTALPFDLPVDAAGQLVVRRGSAYSQPATVAVAAAQPAVFTTDGSGTGQGFVFVKQSLADAKAPAHAGDVAVIYCTGLGALDRTLDINTPAPLSPLYNTANPVTATIGGQPAQVLFAGLTPGFIGLYQVNATVPAGLPPSDQTPVVLSVANWSSPQVTMALQ